MSEQKILIIEDDNMIASMYRKKLEMNGYETYICEDGLMIDSVLSIFNPDTVLLDIMLGKMNGMETFKVIKKYYESIGKKIPRVIVFSNLDNDGLKKEFRQMGITEYLLKSNVEPQELVDYLKTGTGVRNRLAAVA